MATMTAAPGRADVPPARRGNGWRKAAVISGCGLLAVVVGVGLGFWRYADTYTALNPGSFDGPYHVAGAPDVSRQDTDLGTELYVPGPAGTEAKWLTALSNDGGHDITIESVSRNLLVANVQWTPYIVRAGGDATGVRLPPRPLPAQLGAHQTIRLIITFRKPVCAQGLSITTDVLNLRWHALGVDHSYDAPFGIGDGTTFVGCPHHLR